MISVDPSAIRFLREQPKSKVEENAEENVEEKKDGESAEPPAVEAAKTDAKPAATPRTPLATLFTKNKDLTPFNPPPYAAPFLFIPPYIEVSFATCSAIFVRRPTARYNYSEIPSPYEADGEIMRLSWEWYNKVRPRMRSKSQLARMPDNRKETRVIPGIGRAGVPALERHPPIMSGTTLKAQISKNSVY